MYSINKVHFYFVTIFTVFFLSSTNSLSQNQLDGESITVGVYENPPKIFTNNDGQPDGIFIDIIQQISRQENLKIEYVSQSWPQLLKGLENGEIDLLPDVSYSKQRDSTIVFNKIPVMESWLEVYTFPDNKIQSVLELQNKNVGVLAASVQENYVSNEFKNYFALDYNVISFASYEESVLALKNREIDALVADRFFYFSDLYDDEIYATGIVLRPSNLYLGFSQNVDPQVIELFDKNLAEIKSNPKSVYHSIINNWLQRGVIQKYANIIRWIIIAFLALLVIVFGFNFILHRKVRLKTGQLEERNKELIKALEKAEESDRLKAAFLQNMSHEINTPMNGILGFMNLLKEQDLDKKTQEKYIDIVTKSGQRLLTTIENIIQFSKIRSRIVEPKFEEVDVFQFMIYHVQFFQTLAKEKDISLVIEKQLEPKDSIIETDSNILDGIISNLINNAIKFTEKGEVQVGNYLDGNKLVFYVKDSGQGIREDKKETIFNPFVQGDQEINRSYEGSGLGLSLVKEYVALIGGSIWMDSEINKGSNFSFSIPYKQVVKEKTIKEGSKTSFNNKTILVAEDDKISFLLISKILQQQGLKVIRAKTGVEAVEKAKNSPDIGLILMDLKMPEMSGIEAVKNIRKFNKTIPIIAQTAFAKDYQEIVFEVGCDAYLSKPIDKTKLIELLKTFLQYNFVQEGFGE